jgi:hypothetical protein
LVGLGFDCEGGRGYLGQILFFYPLFRNLLQYNEKIDKLIAYGSNYVLYFFQDSPCRLYLIISFRKTGTNNENKKNGG